MPIPQPPYNVIIMDDDCYAMLWIQYILSRDVRTKVLATHNSANDLLNYLQGPIRPDAILVDTEYLPHVPPLPALLERVRLLRPTAYILCLSQYGSNENIRAAIQGGASGFLVKDEIRLALATSVAQACQGDFVTTPRAEEAVRREPLRGFRRVHCLPRWSPNPELTPQITASFWLRVLFGMRASLAAEELGVAQGTVEKYVFLAYQKLLSDYADEAYLEGLDLDAFPSEEKAFTLFTTPPRTKKRLDRVKQAKPPKTKTS